MKKIIVWLNAVIVMATFSLTVFGQNCTPQNLPFTDDFSGGAINPCCIYSSNTSYSAYLGHSGSCVKLNPRSNDKNNQ